MQNKANFVSIKEVLKRLQQQSGLQEKWDQYGLFKKWDQIVGHTLAKHTRPLQWRESILVLEVDHPTWMHEVKMMEPHLIQKIRNFDPELEVRQLKLKLGKHNRRLHR